MVLVIGDCGCESGALAITCGQPDGPNISEVPFKIQADTP